MVGNCIARFVVLEHRPSEIYMRICSRPLFRCYSVWLHFVTEDSCIVLQSVEECCMVLQTVFENFERFVTHIRTHTGAC